MIKAKIFLKYALIQLLILSLFLFVTFLDKENGDVNVVVFGTFIYTPYMLLLAIINITFIITGLYWIKNQFKWLTVFPTLILLLIWWIASNGQIEIHFWKVDQTSFIFLILFLCVLNFWTVYSISKIIKE